jgi:hypothetical protein
LAKILFINSKVALTGEKRGAHKILVGNPAGKRPLGRPMRTEEDNIKTNLKDTGSNDVDWTYLAQNEVNWRAL